jgi:hypothetical protein
MPHDVGRVNFSTLSTTGMSEMSLSRPMETCPSEIWHEIFAFACTDTGLTGRSLSLVSKRFHDISGPLKYQSIAITRWRQLISFSQTFSQLPDLQKKIKYLFIHCPYPFPDVEDDPSLVDPSTDVEDSDLDYAISESDSNSSLDSEFDGSLDYDEEREVLEDIEHIRALRTGLPPGNTRDDHSKDHKIQAVFDEATHALHAILNETSSTLNILMLYCTSFRPLRIHAILSGVVLPFLEEFHIHRCSILAQPMLDDLSTTALLPRLRFLVVSGDDLNNPEDLDIAIIAPTTVLPRIRFFVVSGDCNSDP